MTTAVKISPFLLILLLGAMLVFPMMTKTMAEQGINLPSISIFNREKPLNDSQIYELLTTNVVIDSYSHAMEEHPIEAPIVHACFDQKGPYIQFQVEPKKRYLRVCLIDPDNGILGFQIVDIVNKIAKERTAYIKDRITSLKDLFDYARKMGYTKFTGKL